MIRLRIILFVKYFQKYKCTRAYFNINENKNTKKYILNIYKYIFS